MNTYEAIAMVSWAGAYQSRYDLPAPSIQSQLAFFQMGELKGNEVPDRVKFKPGN